MSNTLKAQPITPEAVTGLAEVIQASGDPEKYINQGLCGRFHDRATLDIEGRPGISVFRSASLSLIHI